MDMGGIDWLHMVLIGWSSIDLVVTILLLVSRLEENKAVGLVKWSSDWEEICQME